MILIGINIVYLFLGPIRHLIGILEPTESFQVKVKPSTLDFFKGKIPEIQEELVGYVGNNYYDTLKKNPSLEGNNRFRIMMIALTSSH